MFEASNRSTSSPVQCHHLAPDCVDPRVDAQGCIVGCTVVHGGGRNRMLVLCAGSHRGKVECGGRCEAVWGDEGEVGEEEVREEEQCLQEGGAGV